MRIFLYIVFSLLSFSVIAEPVKLNFDKVPVIQFIQATYGEILKRNYFLSPDALAIDKVISMKIDLTDIKDVNSVLNRALSSTGLAVTVIDDVVYIDISKPEPEQPKREDLADDEEVIIYRPRYRSVDYLRSLVSIVDRRQQSSVQSALPYNQPALQVQSSGRQLNTGQLVTSSSQVQQMQGQPAMNQGVIQSAGQGSSVADLMVFTGVRKRLDRIMNLLDQVDTPVGAVVIKAALMEITNSDDNSFNLSVALNLLGGKLGISLGSGVVGANSLTFKNSSIDAFITATNGDSRYRIISEPRLLVVDGATGRLSVGSEVPTRSSASVDNNGNFVQSIEYRSSGVILSITPRIYQNRIALRINQQISNFAATQTSAIDSPTLVKRDVETSVELDDGEILVLAGLDESKASSSHSGLSFLPFFTSKSNTDSKSQIVMLLEVQKLQRPPPVVAAGRPGGGLGDGL